MKRFFTLFSFVNAQTFLFGVVLFLMPRLSFGQTTYLGLDGGFEGSATINNSTIQTAPQSNSWTKANATQTITNETGTVRSGANSLKATNGGTGRRIWSPNISVGSTTSSVTIQYYRLVTNITNAQEVQPGIQNNTEGISGTYTSPPSANTWEKITYTKASSTYTSVAGVLLTRSIGTGGNIYLDDICVYTGSIDNTAPNSPTSPIATPSSSTTMSISWTAASGGVDGGGYMVVRGTAAFSTNPNANGIYAVSNTIASGETVAYIGTATNFVDAGLTMGTTYYYRIYTVDKAFNYSTASDVNQKLCPTLTLTGASQSATVCDGSTATINMTGLLASSTNNAIDYTINGVAQTQVTGVSANGTGAASFTTAALNIGNKGQLLRITKITNSSCSTNFTQDVTLAVDAVTNAGSDQTAASSSFTMAANTPSVGTGQWSIISHNSTTTPTITDLASPTTTVTGISAEKSATLQWTITGGVCSPAFDQVVLNNSTPLRVELTIFKAAKGSNNHNYLTWQTATEQNSSLFNIERSTNGQTNWTTIGTVKAAGNSQTTKDYQYTDEAPLSISYYRLRSVDFDGKEQLSNVVSVQQKAGGKLKVFPTAATDKLVISTDNDEVQPYSVFDMLSRNVQTGSVLGQKEINIGSLPVGTYFVKVGAETVKFLKK